MFHKPNPWVLAHNPINEQRTHVSDSFELLDDREIASVDRYIVHEQEYIRVKNEYATELIKLTSNAMTLLLICQRNLTLTPLEGNRVQLSIEERSMMNERNYTRALKELTERDWLKKDDDNIFWINPYRMSAYSMKALQHHAELSLIAYREKKDQERKQLNTALLKEIGVPEESYGNMDVVITYLKKAGIL